MGNCPSSGLKELFEEVITDEDKHQDATKQDDGTPDRMKLLDPRSPLVDAERTPIEVLFKSTTVTPVGDETEEVATDEAHHHKRQLDDPRSISAGIPRTPILVESPLQLNTDSTEATDEEGPAADEQEIPLPATMDTPVQICDTSQKAMAVPKKLIFDVSPSPRKTKMAEATLTALMTSVSSAQNSPTTTVATRNMQKLASFEAPSRTPLAHVQSNTPSRPRSGRQDQWPSSKTKVQGPMSPLQLLHVRQRLAVKRALQLTRGQVENCPPASVENICSGDTQCKPAEQPVKISPSPALATKDPTLRL